MSTAVWTEGRVDALLAALDSCGMSMSPAAAEDLITERVVAQLMRATKATARATSPTRRLPGMPSRSAFSLVVRECQQRLARRVRNSRGRPHRPTHRLRGTR